MVEEPHGPEFPIHIASREERGATSESRSISIKRELEHENGRGGGGGGLFLSSLYREH